jgi:hypothetical protein
VIASGCMRWRGMGRDGKGPTSHIPHAATQIQEQTGEPLATFHALRSLRGAITLRWIRLRDRAVVTHEASHGSHCRQPNDVEETMIEAALNERSARGEKNDRKLVHVAVRQIPLETRGVWVGMCLSPRAAGCTARCTARCSAWFSRVRRPTSGAAKRPTRTRRLHSRPRCISSSHPPL